MADILVEIDTIVLFVILVELAFLLYHIRRMSKQDRCMQSLAKRLDEHGAKLDQYAMQTAETIAELEAKLDSFRKRS